MTTSPSLVLRGSGSAVLRFAGGAVTLGLPDKGHHIPLAAIAVVHARGRTVEVELTAPNGAEPVVYRVEDVSEAAATAFADSVNDALPEEEAYDGAELVTTRAVEAAAPRRWPLAIGAAVPVLALDVFLGAAGGARSAGLFWPALLVVAVGVLLVHVMGRGLYRMWHLPRHGITVVAEFSHHTNRTRVYRYTDTRGASHTYDHNVGGASVEVSYDPRDPKTAVHREGLYVRCMMALMTLVGCGAAGGGLYGIGWLVMDALRH
ncbi:DUF3592 domain-containing protein [Streptomyces sp. NK15101]|uniref:DUF3592 domain-containing protein n=1 Tax=Streptomyces sp. NK15101 TaxID=2873261 RepID=UPI001CEC4E61|nr:DUF3592 domain-containing protein [Streptomyces sp. NK15101]